MTGDRPGDRPGDGTGYRSGLEGARGRALVSGRGLVKHYGRTTVLDGLDIDIPERLFTTLLGPSGCGKTTILRLIAGLEQPDGGTLTLDGTSVLGVPPERRPVHTVFQNYALFPHMTVAENVDFPFRVAGRVPDALARVRATLAMVGMDAHADRYPAELSGGQQKRVALARALVGRPLMLLLDEPLSALDRQLRARLQGELKALQRRLDRAFLFVTHDQAEAFALSDLIIVMNHGRILQRGTPEEIHARPADAFCAGFIGEAALLSGRITDRMGDVAVIGTALGPRRAPVRAGLGAGDRGVLVLRPDMVRPTAPGGPEPQAVVTDVAFTGTGYRLVADCAGLRILMTAARPIAPGEPVGLGLDDLAGFITAGSEQ